MSNYIFPTKIISSKNTDNPNNLLIEKSIRLTAPESVVTTVNKDGYVIVDFGKEYHGYVGIQTGEILSTGDIKIRIRYGESVGECCSDLAEKNAGNNHSLRDMTLSAVSYCEYKTSESGFRFVRIDSNFDGFAIKNIVLFVVEDELKQIGSFNCSDNLVNDIYNTALRTAKLCVQKGVIWDGIKRDRMVWIGDLNPELLSLSQVYGNIPQFKESLDCAEKSFQEKTWVNFIPAYSAWWLTCLYDYFLLTGDKEYIYSKISSIKKVVEAFNLIVCDNGELDFSKCDLEYKDYHKVFFDWPTNDLPDMYSGHNAVIIMGIDYARKILSYFGEDTKKCDRIDCILRKTKWDISDFKQVESFRLLVGLTDNKTVKSILEKGGANGMTGFMSYYILKAMNQCDSKIVLDVIRDYFGSMIKMGATTFWEDFDMEWLKDNPTKVDEIPQSNRKNIHGDFGKFCYLGYRHSLCHGWTSGVLAYLTQYVLGVIPVDFGYSKIKIKPNLYDLEFANGVIPTPYGNIEIKHEKINGKIKTTVNKPKEIEIVE